MGIYMLTKLDEMAGFYQTALGAEVKAQQTIAGVKVVRLQAGETGVGLFDAAEKRAPGVPHHTFDIEGPNDPQELIKELESKAIKTDGMRMAKDRVIRFDIIDPSGNHIELSKD